MKPNDSTGKSPKEQTNKLGSGKAKQSNVHIPDRDFHKGQMSGCGSRKAGGKGY